MNDDLLDLLADDAPDAARRRSEWLRAAAPGHAQVFSRWESVERHVADSVDRALPDREVLVLHALEHAGRSAGFTAGDRERLAGARASLERAAASLASFDAVVGGVVTDAEAFEAAWSAVVELPVARKPAFARDRAAVSDPRRRRRIAARWLSAAIVVAFVATVTLVARRDAGRTLLVAGDTALVETLADGSTVRLQPGSSLSYDPSQPRSVTLAGRAFFDVRHGSTPFVASTAHARVTVLGTTFALATSPESTEIVLVSGRVAAAPLRRPDALTLLGPGERVVIRGEGAGETETIDVARVLEWTGLLLFRSAPLEQAIERVETAYGIRVTIDERLGGERVTGTFTPEQSPGEVVALLAEALGARVVSEGDGRFRIGL